MDGNLPRKGRRNVAQSKLKKAARGFALQSAGEWHAYPPSSRLTGQEPCYIVPAALWERMKQRNTNARKKK